MLVFNARRAANQSVALTRVSYSIVKRSSNFDNAVNKKENLAELVRSMNIEQMNFIDRPNIFSGKSFFNFSGRKMESIKCNEYLDKPEREAYIRQVMKGFSFLPRSEKKGPDRNQIETQVLEYLTSKNAKIQVKEPTIKSIEMDGCGSFMSTYGFNVAGLENCCIDCHDGYSNEFHIKWNDHNDNFEITEDGSVGDYRATYRLYFDCSISHMEGDDMNASTVIYKSFKVSVVNYYSYEVGGFFKWHEQDLKEEYKAHAGKVLLQENINRVFDQINTDNLNIVNNRLQSGNILTSIDAESQKIEFEFEFDCDYMGRIVDNDFEGTRFPVTLVYRPGLRSLSWETPDWNPQKIRPYEKLGNLTPEQALRFCVFSNLTDELGRQLNCVKNEF
jgi:hypothetical protein